MPRVSEAYKEQRRQEILQAAERVFRRKGFGPATMQDLMDETGASRGGLYLYFSSKEDVYMALLEAKSAAAQGEARGLLERSPSVWQAIESYLAQLEAEARTVRDDPDHVSRLEFWLTGLRDEKRRAFSTARYQTSVAFIREVLRAGIERGELQPTLDPDTVARLYLTFLDGLTIHSLFFGSETTQVSSQVAAFRKLLIDVLQPEKFSES
ncbi:MAG TPA: TetR family transcriptional regulator [Stenomitos sp.]